MLISLFQDLRLKEKKLRRQTRFGNLVIDGAAQKDNIIFQETRENVERSFAARGLLDYHWE